MNLDLFKRIFGKQLVEDAEKELNAIKDEWNFRHAKHFADHKALFADHKTLAELLGEVLKKLDEIEKLCQKNEKK